MCYSFRLLGLLFCLFTYSRALPQTLIRDINATVGHVQPDGDSPFFFHCGNYVYFIVRDEAGAELWRTDGTTGGSIRVADLNKGFPDGVAAFDFECLNGLLLYAGNNGESGEELWRTNGQAGIVQRIKDIYPGPASSSPHHFKTLGSKAYFFIQTETGQALWETTGNDAGTQFVVEIPSAITVIATARDQNYLYFTCVITNGTATEVQLWRSDGTAGGTIALSDDAYLIDQPVQTGDQLFFINTSAAGSQLWKTDGTLSGTVVVKDFGFVGLQNLFVFNDKILFNSANAVWISDGSEAGTISLATGNITASVVYSNLFYAVGSDFSANSNFLLRTNGLVGNTEKIVDLGGQPGDLSITSAIPVLADQFILPIHTTENGQEVGISNRLQSGTLLLKDINPGTTGSEPKAWTLLNNKIIFLADDGAHGMELWITDGTTGGTTLLKDCRPGTGDALLLSNSQLDIVNNQLLFLASPSAQLFDTDLWKSDGTEAGTSIYHDFDSNPYLISKTPDALYYFSGSNKLFKTTGLAGGTSIVNDFSADINEFHFKDCSAITLAGRSIFYLGTFNGPSSYGGEYWVTDGTQAGTTVLKDINPGEASAITVVNGSTLNAKYIFSADDGTLGEELWITDGTSAGTSLLKDINDGSDSSTPSLFTTLNSKVLFSANDGVHGNELWQTDGTEAGTSMVINFSKAGSSSAISSLTTVGNIVFFTTYADTIGWRLWKTDGTSNGTTIVYTFSGSVSFPPTAFASSNGKLYFAFNDGSNGNEPWISDGTTDGTFMIDIVAGAASSNPSLFTSVDNFTYFRANGELWKTNGEVDLTMRAASLDPIDMVYLNGWIYFLASSATHGAELYKIQHTKFDQTITFQPIPVKVLGDDPFHVVASSSSGLPLSFTTTSNRITLNNTEITIISAGSITIKASQAGSETFSPAEASQTFCINPAKPVISVSGSSMMPVLTSSNDEGNAWYLNGTLLTGATGKTLTIEETGTYTVQTTIDNCSSVFSDELVVTVVGIEDPDNWIKVYPNPATETIRIDVTGVSSRSTVQVIDMAGRMLHQADITGDATIDHRIADYPPALYLVKVVFRDQVRVKKFVKR